jgi:hypothetical protein
MRQLLPFEMVRFLAWHKANLSSERGHSGRRWRGRCAKLVDGTGSLMPDTVANQACYQQSSSQAIGVGPSLARFLGVICLLMGALTLRELKVYKKRPVIDFLRSRCTLKTTLGAPFRRRWHVELDLRAVKTTLQAAELSCNTIKMTENRVWFHFLACNSNGLLEAEAAQKATGHPCTLRTQLTARGLRPVQDGSIHLLFTLIGQCEAATGPGASSSWTKTSLESTPTTEILRARVRADIAAYGYA